MKLFQSICLSGILATRMLALDVAEITALSARFAAPTGDEQYQARIGLDRLVDQATFPGKGDAAAVTVILVQAIQAPGTCREAKKYLLRALSRVGTEDAIKPLASLLFDLEPSLREEARFTLASIQDPKAMGMLESALTKASDRRDKLGLINSLGTCKSETSVVVLAPRLVDSDPEISAAAANALAGIGGVKASEALKKALTSAQLAPALKPTLETAIVVANPTDLDDLTAVYQSTTSDPAKTAAFIALMKSAPDNAKSAWVKDALKGQSADLCHEAISSGIQSGDPAIQAAIVGSAASMSREDRLVLLANAHGLKPVAVAEDAALKSLSSEDEEERIIALATLGKIGTRPAFDAVLQSLGAREPRVNQAAANALGCMSYPAAESRLLALLKGVPGPDKILAIRALTSRHLDGASGILLEILEGNDESASREAMKSMYFIATPADLEMLCAEALATKDEAVKQRLSSLCKRIASRIKTPEALALVRMLG